MHDAVLMGLMPSRRSFVVLVACATLLSYATLGAPARAADQGAGEFIKVLGESAVEVLRDKENTSFSEREAKFRKLFVKGFHIGTISRFVLGRYWKTATKEQLKKYNDVFLDFLVRVYASRFDSYNGETFEVLDVLDGPNDKDTIVRTRILRPSGGEPVGVDYRVRKFDGEYKVVDVNVEGISMLHTHRVEFASVINRKGMDGFLSDLQERLDDSSETAVN